MQSVRNQGDQTIYQYNALGERVRKSNNQEQTDYLYDEEGKLLGEYGKSGQAKAEYLWLGDIPVGVVKFDTTGQQATLYYVESDQLNTPRMVTTQNKKVMWQWFSEPFGSTQVVNNPAGQGPFTYNLRFPGQYYDRESGLHYNYYRDYDPATGRYIQSDPIGLGGGVNTYAYVGNNPIKYADPLGLVTECELEALAEMINKFGWGVPLMPKDIKTDPRAIRGAGKYDGENIYMHTNPSESNQYWGSVTARGMSAAFVITGLHENIHRMQHPLNRQADAIKELVTKGSWSNAQDNADIIVTNCDTVTPFLNAVKKCRQRKNNIDPIVEHK